LVGRLGLSYDVSLYHTQIGEVADLAGALPNTRIVLNHVGGVLGLGSYRSKQEEVFFALGVIDQGPCCPAQRVRQARRTRSKLHCLALRWGPRTAIVGKVAARFRPYVETCITAFGASRCMFESNFPVDKISYSYPVSGMPAS